MQLPICPNLPAGAPATGAENQKGESSARETRTLRIWTGSELRTAKVSGPTFCPCILKLKSRNTFCHPFVRLWWILYITKAFFFFLRIFNRCLLTSTCCCNGFSEHGWAPLLHSSAQALYSSHTSLLIILENTKQASASGPLQLLSLSQPETFFLLLAPAYCFTSFRSPLLWTLIRKNFSDLWI